MSLEISQTAAGAPGRDGSRPIAIGRLDLIAPGEGRCFALGALRLAVFRLRDNRIFALDASCPHAGGPLADGLVGAGVVVCPLHAQRFCLGDGAGLDSDLRVNTYRVEVRDGWILLAGCETS